MGGVDVALRTELQYKRQKVPKGRGNKIDLPIAPAVDDASECYA